MSLPYKFILKLSLLFAFLLGFTTINTAFSGTNSKFSVEFSVNMTKAIAQQVFNPDSDAVYILLDHGIDTLQMVQGPDHVWSLLVSATFDSSVTYTYKYRINRNQPETVNRSFTAKDSVTYLSDWWNNDPVNRTTFLVNMAYAKSNGIFNPATDSVCIVGTMNNMVGSPRMARVDTSLVYSYTYTLDPESIQIYKFRINADVSGMELKNKSSRLLRVPDTILQVSCDFDNFNPGKRLMTFRCNMGYYMTANHFNRYTDFLDLAGNFNGWGSNDVLFDFDYDSVFTIDKYIDTTWFHQGPLAFRFRINGNWSQAELTATTNRSYTLHDTINLNPNVYSCFYNNLDPAVPTPPWAYDLSINGLLIYKKILNGSYMYENVNGIHEGASTYQWYRSDNALGLNAVAIDSAWKINYVVDTLDISKWLVFEVTPKASSGDSAVGKPVRVVASNNISAWDVGISEHGTVSISIYPNPVQDFLNVITDQKIEKLEIMNTLGQVLISKTDLQSIKTSLETSVLSRGFYLLRVQTKTGNTGVARLIKP